MVEIPHDRMIRELKGFSGSPGWTFSLVEGSILGRRKLSDREIEIDLSGFSRLETSNTVRTQVHVYVGFFSLQPIHKRIDDVLYRTKARQDDFHVHERESFNTEFSAQWRTELVEVLSRIERWAAALDPLRSILTAARNRPDRPFVPQINHLVALAFLGDFTILEDYLSAFKKGFRLNFVPAITREVIEAALDVSYDCFADRDANSDLGATPNGRSTALSCNSGIAEGPPSVS